VWRPDGGAPQELAVPAGMLGLDEQLTLAPDGAHLLAAARDGGVVRVDLATHAAQRYALPEGEHVTAFALDPLGDLVAAASWEGGLRVWTVQGALVERVSLPLASVRSLRFDPTGRRLVLGLACQSWVPLDVAR